MINCEIQIGSMAAAAAVAAVLGAAAACWLCERGLLHMPAGLPRTRKAVARLVLASLIATGAVRYGGSKGMRESEDTGGMPPSAIVDGGQGSGRPTLRSGCEPHFTFITPTNGCILLRMAMPPGGVPDDTLDIFCTTNLLTSWSLLGEIAINPSTVTSEVIVASSDFPAAPSVMPASAFFASGTHVDSDGDGVYDGRERFLHGTDPSHWDADGDGLSDGEEIAAGIDPLSRDTDGDGYPDDEEIASSTNPLVANSGAATTIRHVYDNDDRLTATYVDAGGGAAITEWTSTGDPAVTAERATQD